MRRLRPVLFLIPLAFALSGCVAAIVPVLASGAMARSVAHKKVKHGEADAAVAKQARPSPVATASAPAPAPSLPALPTDVAAIRPGQFYAGRLPPPGPSAPAAPEPVAAISPPRVAPPPRPSASSWSDVGHFVAADLSPEHSVLLARGSGAADPRWVACAGKPPAIVAGAATVLAPGSGAARALDPAARSWLDALRVLGAGTVLVATDPSDAAAAKAAFGKAGLPAPVDGDTLRLAGAASELPAIRAGIGARYCVVALVGRSGADFPDGLTPDATPAALGPLWGRGWFLLP